MKKIFRTLAIVISYASILSAKPPRELKFEPLEFHPPQVERAVLKNGTTVLLLPDHELPLINLTAFIRTGSMYEPAYQAGLASLAGTLIRGGGTQSRSREELDEALEFMGASVETGMDLEMGTASLSSLAKDFDKTLEFFADVLTRPAFNQEKLEIEKAKLIETIRRRNDEPFDIARREFRRSVYGDAHPIARTPQIPSVKKISGKDIRRFHEKYYAPNNMMIAATGDFDLPDMVKKLEKAFEGWKPKKVDFPVPEKTDYKKFFANRIREVVHAEKDLSQTSILLGHLGIKRHNSDRFALEVMNEILGGSAFSSRLYKEVRSRQGLAYWVGSNFSEPYDYGTIAMGSQTKSESVGKTIRILLSEVERITKEEVSQEELQLAKDAIINSFVFRYNSPQAIVNQKMFLEYFGFPANYLENYDDKIAKVTAQDVLETARKYLKPSQMVLAVVGKEKDFDLQLSEFGQVKKADLQILE